MTLLNNPQNALDGSPESASASEQVRGDGKRASASGAQTSRTRLLVYSVCFVLALLAGFWFGLGYSGRLANHAGYFMVGVDDQVAAPQPAPRHTLLIVVDGLRRDAAERMNTVAALREAGQCRVSEAGPISISRAMYATISCGLEQDRTGCRNNSETAPLAADSIWQIARRNGRRVAAISEELFFQQLFQDGFDSYQTPAEEVDYFAQAELTDLSLIHPLYVDTNGHEYGAASPQYAAAVERSDGEAIKFLSRLDLRRDLVVFTADHGHSDAGGHGGSQPEVTEVLTCFAGRGVRHSKLPAKLDPVALAPTLAVLQGLPFPRHMRAQEDSLGVIWEIVDSGAFEEAYLADRRAAIARFRNKNAAQLKRWTGSERAGSWAAFYAIHRNEQRLRIMGVGLAMAAALAALLWRWGLKPWLSFCCWVVVTVALACAGFIWLKGSFDFTAINSKREFIQNVILVCGSASIVTAFVHARIHGSLARLLREQLSLVVLAFWVGLAHAFVYGWTLGFPIPPPKVLFLPFFCAGVTVSGALVGIGVVGLAVFKSVALSTRQLRG